MSNMQFKTNINCGGCIKAVTPALDASAGKGNWQVDTGTPEKILSISGGQASADEVIRAIKRMGFTIEIISR